MEFLAHRGLWFEKGQKNTMEALTLALREGYGLETDVRDQNGELVISHDMALPGATPFEDLLSYYKSNNFSSTLAINIKSDGLQKKLHDCLARHEVANYFVFDMSIPDTLGYLKRGIKTYVRRSEIENHPELTRVTQGVWLDELQSEWIDEHVIINEAKLTQSVCIVSAELHGRDFESQWRGIKGAIERGCATASLMLCTDFPQKAERYFK